MRRAGPRAEAAAVYAARRARSTRRPARPACASSPARIREHDAVGDDRLLGQVHVARQPRRRELPLAGALFELERGDAAALRTRVLDRRLERRAHRSPERHEHPLRARRDPATRSARPRRPCRRTPARRCRGAASCGASCDDPRRRARRDRAATAGIPCSCRRGTCGRGSRTTTGVVLTSRSRRHSQFAFGAPK